MDVRTCTVSPWLSEPSETGSVVGKSAFFSNLHIRSRGRARNEDSPIVRSGRNAGEENSSVHFGLLSSVPAASARSIAPWPFHAHTSAWSHARSLERTHRCFRPVAKISPPASETTEACILLANSARTQPDNMECGLRHGHSRSLFPLSTRVFQPDRVLLVYDTCFTTFRPQLVCLLAIIGERYGLEER